MLDHVKKHFRNRSNNYNISSAWVYNDELIKKIISLTDVNKKSIVLDVATGTGLIAKQLQRKADRVIGVDICDKMLEQAKEYLDEIIVSKIEDINLPDNSVDICTCRQGLQFTDLNKSLKQIFRVLKSNGVIVLCHLTTYLEENNEDKKITFEIQRLRNPARKNFFGYNSVQKKLNDIGFKNITTFPYKTTESIQNWTNNAAIDENRKNQIYKCYHDAPKSYLQLHNVKFTCTDIYDDMMLAIIKANK